MVTSLNNALRSLWKRLAPFTYAAYTGDMEVAIDRLRREGHDAAWPADPWDVERAANDAPSSVVLGTPTRTARTLRGEDRLRTRPINGVTRAVYVELYPHADVLPRAALHAPPAGATDRLIRRARVVVDRSLTELR